MWNFLDREADIEISRRNRPHWDQTGALTFVTFRLADSLPKSVIERWQAEQLDWLNRNGLSSVTIDDALIRDQLPERIRRLFVKFRTQKWNESLDDCHGRCLLRDQGLATIVGNTLLKFDGDRYDCERFDIYKITSSRIRVARSC